MSLLEIDETERLSVPLGIEAFATSPNGGVVANTSRKCLLACTRMGHSSPMAECRGFRNLARSDARYESPLLASELCSARAILARL